MTTLTQAFRPLPIIWKFQIVEQGFTARYGLLGNEFYKQYLPFGVTDEIHHPPKRIDQKLYNLARIKLSSGSTSAKAG